MLSPHATQLLTSFFRLLDSRQHSPWKHSFLAGAVPRGRPFRNPEEPPPVFTRAPGPSDLPHRPQSQFRPTRAEPKQAGSPEPNRGETTTIKTVLCAWQCRLRTGAKCTEETASQGAKTCSPTDGIQGKTPKLVLQSRESKQGELPKIMESITNTPENSHTYPAAST